MATKTMEETEVAAGQISPEQFLEGLNVDLANEFSAVILYRTYASQVQGQWRMELRQFFEAEIPDELGHAQILADKIVALGGTPTTVPAPVKPARDAKEMLRNALDAEIETIDRYVKRRSQAAALGHHGLAVDFDDLIQDETKHRDEIQLILRRWDTG
ncbi:MAG TPA: ferritin-like domain-containing protein [Thermoanaerobaculia bacterium]|jgi:bacterioferritin|nr:ferritin-like domain-containing protein [Thermoanaerobaculia bacterium]